MKKTVVSSLVTVLLVSAQPVFAQFNSPLKAAKNWDNLRRVVVNAVHKPSVPRIISWVPARFTAGQQVALTPAKLPQVVTPVTRSLLAKAGPAADAQQMHRLGTLFVLGAYGEPGYGRAFYEDQSELARDLNGFYKGEAQVRISPNGHEVKLYALPLDGILYKASSYKVPVVLNSQDYFVIYDTQTKTGQIAENIPEVYNLFKPRMYDEIWQAMGASKEFDDLNNLCDAILTAHLHKARIDQLHADKIPQDVQDLIAKGQMSYADFVKMKTADTKTLVKESKSVVYQQLNNIDELVPYLKQLPVVRQTSKGFKAYVVELPVDGLTWVDRENVTHIYTRQEHVMLFFEFGAVGVFPRVDIENPQLFTAEQ